MVDLTDEQQRAVDEVRRALPDKRLLLIGATASGKLVWPHAEMNMEGFDLAFEHAVADGELLVPPAPVIGLLKMRSWLDRPVQRRKDSWISLT